MPKKKETKNLIVRNSTVEFLTFSYQSGGDGVEVLVSGGTVWLTQKLMGGLFETTPENVLTHLKNIYKDGELDETATAKDFLVVQREGNRNFASNMGRLFLNGNCKARGRTNPRYFKAAEKDFKKV